MATLVQLAPSTNAFMPKGIDSQYYFFYDFSTLGRLLLSYWFPHLSTHQAHFVQAPGILELSANMESVWFLKTELVLCPQGFPAPTLVLRFHLPVNYCFTLHLLWNEHVLNMSHPNKAWPCPVTELMLSRETHTRNLMSTMAMSPELGV